jgi:glycosyltransferase involved in cell wall biosynthesis
MPRSADSRELRILHVVPTLDPTAGGVPVAALQFAESIRRVISESIIVTLDAADAPWLRDARPWVVALGPSRMNFRLNGRLRHWLVTHASAFDAVVAHGIWQYPALAVRLASKEAGFPYFVFTHGQLDPWFKHAFPLKHVKKWLYWPWGTYPILRDAAAVLFTSEEERRLAQESFWLYRANEAVVTLGVARPAGDPEAQSALFFESYGRLRGKRFLLFLSRLDEKKGCDLLIKAFSEEARRHEDLCLVIAGPSEGRYRATLEAEARAGGAQERIVFTGMLTGAIKWGAYASAEAFVLPSHSENFGLVIVESLACGTPVLISDRVNIWREIIQARAGLVSKDTLEGTRRLLEDWLGLTQNERRHMSERARACYETRFELTVASKGTVELIQQSLV